MAAAVMGNAATRVEGWYREHGPALLGYLRRRFSTEAAGISAEDLLQETFVMALRGSDRAGEYGSVRGWLFGVARNVGLTAVRRRPRHHELRWDVETKPPENDCRAAEVKDAINELPAGMREALELRLQENLSYDEIAAALAIPVGTVRSRLHNAVRLLRERLRD